jgi:serine/threonine-protein kinase
VLADFGYLYETSPLPPDDLALRSPVLIIESGTNRGARTVLGLADGERRELGRPDIAGNDHSISRRHLEFSRSADHYFVRDLDSKNGTLLRGSRLEAAGSPIEIRHGDRIKVGDIFLRFVFLHDS